MKSKILKFVFMECIGFEFIVWGLRFEVWGLRFGV